MKEVMDLSTKIIRCDLRAEGFNPLLPSMLDDWYYVTIRSSNSAVIVGRSSGEAKSGSGISIPIDGSVTTLAGPGTQLYAAGAAGDVVSVAMTPIPTGLKFLAMFEESTRTMKALLMSVNRLVETLQKPTR